MGSCGGRRALLQRLRPHCVLCCQQVRAIPVRKDDEVQVVRGTFKVWAMISGQGKRSGNPSAVGPHVWARSAAQRSPCLRNHA